MLSYRICGYRKASTTTNVATRCTYLVRYYWSRMAIQLNLYNDDLWDLKIVAVFNRWSLVGGYLCSESSIWDHYILWSLYTGGHCSEVVVSSSLTVLFFIQKNSFAVFILIYSTTRRTTRLAYPAATTATTSCLLERPLVTKRTIETSVHAHSKVSNRSSWQKHVDRKDVSKVIEDITLMKPAVIV